MESTARGPVVHERNARGRPILKAVKMAAGFGMFALAMSGCGEATQNSSNSASATAISSELSSSLTDAQAISAATGLYVELCPDGNSAVPCAWPGEGGGGVSPCPDVDTSPSHPPGSYCLTATARLVARIAVLGQGALCDWPQIPPGDTSPNPTPTVGGCQSGFGKPQFHVISNDGSTAFVSITCATPGCVLQHLQAVVIHQANGSALVDDVRCLDGSHSIYTSDSLHCSG